MLDHLPHPTLLPRTESSFNRDGLEIASPLPTFSPPTSAHSRSHSTLESTSIWPSSRTTSPSRSSAFLPPFLKPNRGRSLSPERVSPREAAEFETTAVDEQSEPARNARKSMKLASWFSGTSEPVSITLLPSPSKEKHDPFFDSADMDRGSARSSLSRENEILTKRPSSRAAKSHSSLVVSTKDSPSSKFAFWRSKAAISPQKDNFVDDKLSTLDIQEALFPSGKLGDSPSEDFKNLQTNAENALRAFKSAYQKNLQLVRDVTSEKAALTDELEAAQTRSEHTKMQLADMADKLAKQESDMQRLAQELATVRRQHAEFRNRSLRIVTPEPSDADSGGRETGSDHPNLRRQTHRSTDSISSSDHHSPSSISSVFSQPTLGSCTPVSATDDAPTHSDVFHPTSPTKAAYQKRHSVRPSEAWDVVDVLTEENGSLKARLVECENANEDALALLKLIGSA